VNDPGWVRGTWPRAPLKGRSHLGSVSGVGDADFGRLRDWKVTLSRCDFNGRPARDNLTCTPTDASLDAGTAHMIKTVEAVIDEHGNVRLLEPVRAGAVRRALVTILDERPTDQPSETALLSGAALAEDWDRPEEDDAWKHLQKVR